MRRGENMAEQSRSKAGCSKLRTMAESSNSLPDVAASKKRMPLSTLTNKGAGSGNGTAAAQRNKPNIIPCRQGSAQATTSKVRSRVIPCGRDSEIHKISAKSSVPKHLGKARVVLKAPERNAASSSSVSSCPDESASLSGVMEPNIKIAFISDSSASPNAAYTDGGYFDIAALERETAQSLSISKNHSKAKSLQVHCLEESSLDVAGVEGSQYINIDCDNKDPQLCTLYASDIYDHLHKIEKKRRPRADYMEFVQQEINTSMREILIDWLVEVAEEYKLVPETLYLSVAYIDRYLSCEVVDRQRLQLVGVSCMLIASKHEEICPPQVEEFCYITDNTYFRDEVLKMERQILAQLHFELSIPTTKCFLGRFIRSAQVCNKLEFLANYLAELTLLEYSFLHYLPSLIAASVVFLSKLTLDLTTRPWNVTLQHYTRYRASELRDCVKHLHELQCNTKNCSLSAIRDKYCQHKFKCVSTLVPPVVIHSDLFLDIDS